jgi:hypothetical protein
LILVENNIFPILISNISNKAHPNLFVQYAAVGVLRSILSLGGNRVALLFFFGILTNELDNMTKIFASSDGIKPLISLARGEMRPDIVIEETEGGATRENKDKRVEYEATRLLVRISDNGGKSCRNVTIY